MTKPYAGYAIAVAILLSMLNGFRPDLVNGLWAGSVVIVAFALLVVHLKRQQQWQVGLMAAIGVIAMACGYAWSGELNLTAAIIGNQRLITLLAAVSFLSLVIKIAAEGEPLPRGKKALAKTYTGVHIFGSVINMTVMSMAGDRIAGNNGFQKHQFMVINRGLASVVFWSPFTAAIAAVLHYQPDTDITQLIWSGLPLAGAAMLYTFWQIQRTPREEIDRVTAYPISFQSLWVPVLLVVMVLTSHAYFPSLPVISLITAYALLVVIVVLLLTQDMRSIWRKLDNHCATILPKMSGELALFVAAGILAAGLGSLVVLWPELLPTTAVTPYSAVSLTVLVVISALLGIHPVAMVTVISVALANTNSDHGLVAMALIAGWAIGVAVSPLSGLGIIVQSRYHVRARDIIRWNAPYGVLMLVMTALWMVLIF